MSAMNDIGSDALVGINCVELCCKNVSFRSHRYGS